MRGWTQLCEDCGVPYEAHRRNSKRCPVCRAYTDALYVGDMKKKCFLCSKEFAPINTRDSYCGEHAIKVVSHGHGTCSYCKEDGPRAWRGVTVCASCARRTGNDRRGLLQQLLKKVNRQKLEAPQLAAEHDEAEAERKLAIANEPVPVI